MATKQWVDDGRLVLLGIAQEQHADRNRLFSQWKGFDFPILHDAINLMGARAVPVVIAIDEYGIVRAVGPNLAELEDQFIERVFEAPTGSASPVAVPKAPNVRELERQAEEGNSVAAWRALGGALVLWHGDERIDEAIGAYEKAVALDAEDGTSLFRLGVCYNLRHESGRAKPGDFQRAADRWREALATDPGQYIWRRRIQQYGPLSDKPYPFYNWTERAADDIRERGERPVPLRSRPTGSEAAVPKKRIGKPSQTPAPPDPEGLVGRDKAGLVLADAAAVPSQVASGGDLRVHVTLRPNPKREAHWNNEAEPLQLWVELPDGWESTARLLTAPQPATVESSELRRLDFGLHVPEGASPGRTRLSAYALYYACEDVTGTCSYLRQDITVDVVVSTP